MATGLIATLGASSSVTYTAPTDCKLTISATGGGTNGGAISLNGIQVMQVIGNSAYMINAQVAHYLGAGQSLTVSTGPATFATLSALES